MTMNIISSPVPKNSVNHLGPGAGTGEQEFGEGGGD